MKVTFKSPEKLHMRPSAQIATFALNAEKENPGIRVFISYAEKRVQATSIIALGLLGIDKGHTFSLEIKGGSQEQMIGLVQSFGKLLVTALSSPELHTERRDFIMPPSGLEVRGVDTRHPNSNEFQERYEFLIRVKGILEESREYFYRSDALTYDEQEKIKKAITLLAQEEKAMQDKNHMTLGYGWIVRYLYRSLSKPQLSVQEYERVINYLLPNAIIETQRHLGTLPIEVLAPIYNNLHIVLSLQLKLDKIDTGESLKNACDTALSEMVKMDKADIYRAMLHDFSSEYQNYLTIIDSGEKVADALNRYKEGIRNSISYWIEYSVTGFLNPD